MTTSLTRPARLLAAAIAVAALSGCSALSGGSSSSPRPPSSRESHGVQAARVRQAQRTHEYPGPLQHQSAGVGSPSPVVAVEAFATAYINWTADTVSSRMRALPR